MRTDWRSALDSTKTIAVVGLSQDPFRPSHEVAQYLQSSGFRVVPVNPGLSEEVLGEVPYPALAELPEPVDALDVFRRSEEIPALVREILALPWTPKLVWLQLGVHARPEDRKALEDRGVAVVEGRCMKAEHAMAH